jgi:hypothetical protein
MGNDAKQGSAPAGVMSPFMTKPFRFRFSPARGDDRAHAFHRRDWRIE